MEGAIIELLAQAEAALMFQMLVAASAKSALSKKIRIIVPKVQNVSKITSYQSAFSDNKFFRWMFEEKSLKDSSREKLLYNFFKERRESQSKAIATLLSNTTLKELLVKYNSAMSCSAAMECLFLFGEDVRQLEQSELSDRHFEELVFLKLLCFNKILFFVMFCHIDATFDGVIC